MDIDLSLVHVQARSDFERAHRKAFLSEISAFLGRRPNTLLSFDAVQHALPMAGQVYRGLQQVPVTAIRGSVDRYEDFNRNFLPLRTHTRPRWEAIDRMAIAQETLPPIQLYKIGEVYFVKDGNHRVSVAREQGQDMIDAEVIEWSITVPLALESDPRDLIRLAEYARFLEQTRLDKLRPGVAIQFTSLGRYDELLEHISAHRWYMGIERKREIGWEEAVVDWYDDVYRPLVHVIEETGVLKGFPGRTASDLYLWIMDHRYYLEREVGHAVGPTTAVMSYDAQYGTWGRRVLRTLRRLTTQARQPLAVTGRQMKRALSALHSDG